MTHGPLLVTACFAALLGIAACCRWWRDVVDGLRWLAAWAVLGATMGVVVLVETWRCWREKTPEEDR